jgi:dihydrolipoamide dehydrogenase
MVVGEFTQETDFVVIGGGPGGYSAAFRAAELGVETTIVDPAEQLGGNWLHNGCVPSKAMLHLANSIRQARHLTDLGVRFGPPSIDLPQLNTWMQRTIDMMADDLDEQCARHGIHRISGTATFESSRQVRVHNGGVARLHFRRALIATGSCDTPLAEAIDSPRVLYATQALQTIEIPETLLVVGHRSISLELANMYSALGSKVTIAAPADRLLPHADPDLVEPLEERLRETMDEICLDAHVLSMKDTGHGVTVKFRHATPRRTEFDRVLIALGREPNTEALDLSRTNVSTDDCGFIKVDAQMHTTDPRIFAVGDVIGQPMLWHKAMNQGRVAAEVIAGWGSEYDARAVPMVLFTDPQVAWCGMTEQQVEASNHAFEVRRIAWSSAGRSDDGSRGCGMTKMIFDPDTQLLLGMGIVGPNAAQMIAEGVLAIEMGAVMEDLAAMTHPHVIGEDEALRS